MTGTADIHLYDSEENEISDPALELTQTSVTYRAQVVKTKTVNIEVKTSGTPEEGYRVSGIELNQSQVVIYGDANALNSIDKIVIPASAVNVDGLRENKVFKFSLTDYIDKSLHIINNSRVEVTVKIEVAGSKKISLNTSDIKVTGLEAGMSYSFEDRTFDIEIEGTDAVLAALDTSKISLSANLSSYTLPGSRQVAVSVVLPEGCSLKSSPMVKVILRKESETGSSQETTTAGTTTTIER